MNLTHLLLFKYKSNINSDFLIQFFPTNSIQILRKQLYLVEFLNVWTRMEIHLYRDGVGGYWGRVLFVLY